MAKYESIRVLDINNLDETSFSSRYVGCIVLTHDHKILLQQRGPDWDRYPNCLATFGGKIEPLESPRSALLRELNEELGAIVSPADVITISPISETYTDHTELIYTYFWHDKNNTITGCYEGEAKQFDNISEALNHPQIMADAAWLLNQCQHLL